MALTALLRQAEERRAPLRRQLEDEDTDCWRCFHGATEGYPGLSVDRYGESFLAQSFHGSLGAPEVRELRDYFGERLYLRDRTARPEEEAEVVEALAREFGLSYRVGLQHRGIDPWLFLDFRVARRWLRGHASGKTVLNLFAYTGSAGMVCSAFGAASVCQVDFSAGNLDVAAGNYRANGLQGRAVEFIKEDCYPVLWQFAGRPVKGRAARRRRFKKLEPRRFDLIILDPPAWSKGAFGAVDLVNDYSSLLKPCLECLAEDGVVLCSNNVASVAIDDFRARVVRCAEKAGRPVKQIEQLMPDSDFPSPDGRPPLKLLVLTC